MTNDDFETDAQLWSRATSDNSFERGDALAQLAHRAYHRKQYDEAANAAASARDAFSAGDFPREEAHSCYLQGQALYKMQRNDEALTVFERAVELYRTTSNEVDLADALEYVAWCLERLDRRSEAEEPYRSAVALFAGSDHEARAGLCSLGLGEVLGGDSRQSEALEVFREALSYFQKAADIVGAARAHDRIAAALIDLGGIVEAIEHLREALRILEFARNTYRLTWAQYRLGWTLVTRGEYDEAIPLLKEASKTFRENDDFVLAARANRQLAHALKEQGYLADAQKMYETVRSVFLAAGETEEAILVDTDVAIMLSENGDVDGAISIYRRLLSRVDVQESIYHLRSISTLLAKQLIKIQHPESAGEALRLMLDVSLDEIGENVQERAKVLTTTAQAFLALNHYDEAERKARAVLDLGDHSGIRYEWAGAYAVLSEVARERNHQDDADDLLSKSIALYLADGAVARASELSKFLLPDDVKPSPSDGWVLFPDLPTTGEIPVVKPEAGVGGDGVGFGAG